MGADAAVVAPLAIADVDDPVAFVTRAIGEVFERRGRTLPIFLYDNAAIAVAGRATYLAGGVLRQMARLNYVHGIKVTASKEVFASYARPPAYFKLGGNFAIYPGNAYLIFGLFKPSEGIAGRMREYWSRYPATPHLAAWGGCGRLERDAARVATVVADMPQRQRAN